MPKAFLGPDGNWQYTVKSSVGVIDGTGTACPNERRDVMLVQYLLRQTNLIQGRFTRNQTRGGGIGVGAVGKPLAVDGIFGQATHYAILLFSLHGESGFFLDVAPGFVARHVRDGRVLDRTLGSLINLEARLAMGDKRFNSLVDLPDVPLDLRAKLKEQSKSLAD
jgi:hypothetical protein